MNLPTHLGWQSGNDRYRFLTSIVSSNDYGHSGGTFSVEFVDVTPTGSRDQCFDSCFELSQGNWLHEYLGDPGV